MAQRGEEIETEEKRLSIKFIQHLAQKSKDECKDCTNLNPSRNWDFIKAVDVSEKLQYYLSIELKLLMIHCYQGYKDILFDGLTCKTREHFTNCGVFFRSPKGREITRTISKIPICSLVVYVKTSNKGFILPLLFHFKRTGTINFYKL